MKIDMGTVQINQLAGDPAQLWTMPAFDGYQKYDLGGALPNTQLPGRPTAQYAPGTVMPAAYQPRPANRYPSYPAPSICAVGERAAKPQATAGSGKGCRVA